MVTPCPRRAWTATRLATAALAAVAALSAPLSTGPARAQSQDQAPAQAQTPAQAPPRNSSPNSSQDPSRPSAQLPAPAQAGPEAAAGSRRQPLPRSPLLIVNRQAVLENSAAAHALQRTERETLERVTVELERVKEALQAEEQELTRLKDTLPVAEFEARARAFDRRVKAERNAGQDRRALFQQFTSEARQALASALPRVLEQLRREAGALVILDSSAVAAADPGLDVTQAAIHTYDQEMGDVRFDPPPGLIPGTGALDADRAEDPTANYGAGAQAPSSGGSPFTAPSAAPFPPVAPLAPGAED